MQYYWSNINVSGKGRDMRELKIRRRRYTFIVPKLMVNARDQKWDRESDQHRDRDRCTVIKVPHPKREGGQVLLLQNYPHPLSLRGRGPYHFPTPLNT